MFAFLGLIVGWLAEGASAIIEAAVVALQWAVAALWAFATSVYNGLIALGSHVLEGFQKAWDFLKNTYEDVVKPALGKLATLFERVKTWLNDTFGPVLRLLRTIRNYILGFYAQWIRPVLDAIDQTRSILKILEALHIQWAQTLDNVLGTIENAVNQALIDVLGPLNKVIGIVNGVVTANLLFQRVPYLRTLLRDVNAVQHIMTSARSRKLSISDQKDLEDATTVTPPAELHGEIVDWLSDEQSDATDSLDAMRASFVEGWSDATS